MGMTGEAKRIMVVEDEGIVALDIKDSLEKHGYEVVALASSGDEALAESQRTEPELILMDIRLGSGMDGVETAAAIRARSDIPVIYLSAYTDEETLSRAKRTGPFGYLVKPFSEAELKTSIEMSLFKHAMERCLVEREKWLHTTLRSIGDGVIATRADGKILFMNPVAQRLTAWEEAEAMGQDFTEIFCVVHPEGDLADGEFFRRVIESGQGAELKAETLVRSRDGRQFPVEDSVAPILEPGGKVSGLVLVFRDVGEKVAAAKALRQSEERLMHAQKLESLGRLAGGIAHDFNNFLAAINGYSEILLKTMRRDDPLREMVVGIRDAGLRAGALTRRLLAYSRRQVLKPVPMDLNATVEGMAGMLRRLIGPGIELRTELNPLAGRVKVDPGQLEQVIMNLVINARDAMPEGGRIVLKTSQSGLEQPSQPCEPTDPLPVLGPGRFAVLEVSDNGVGMDEETRARIFEPFFTTKPDGKGTGLGLSMVWGIVKQSGGCVSVRSRPGEGTTFLIDLPLHGDGASNAAAGAGADCTGNG